MKHLYIINVFKKSCLKIIEEFLWDSGFTVIYWQWSKTCIIQLLLDSENNKHDEQKQYNCWNQYSKTSLNLVKCSYSFMQYFCSLCLSLFVLGFLSHFDCIALIARNPANLKWSRTPETRRTTG